MTEQTEVTVDQRLKKLQERRAAAGTGSRRRPAETSRIYALGASSVAMLALITGMMRGATEPQTPQQALSSSPAPPTQPVDQAQSATPTGPNEDGATVVDSEVMTRLVTVVPVVQTNGSR